MVVGTVTLGIGAGAEDVRPDRAAGAGHVRTSTVIGRIAPATALVTLGTLPVFLIASLSVVMRPDIVIPESRVGAAVATNYLVAMVCSMPAGRRTQRRGARHGLGLGVVLSLAGVLVVVLARSWAAVVLAMVLTGAATAFLQVAANLAISSDVPQDRLGFAYSVKQSAIPLATLGAGLAVPLATAVLPWRAVFIMVLLGVLLAWVSVGSAGPAAHGDPSERRGRLPVRALAPLALGVAAASAAATSAAAFLVPSLVTIGVGAAAAGGLLAVSSVLTVLTRVLVGQARDRWRLDGLRIMIVQVSVGAGALLVIAASSDGGAAMVVAVLVAFLVGWAWSGVFTDAIVRSDPASAAASTGVTQVGVYLGGGGGPLLFGRIAEAQGYAAAWTVAAGLFVAAAVLVAIGRARLPDAVAPVHRT